MAAPRFEVFEVSLTLVRAAGPVLVAIGRRDRALATQLRRALSSVALNVAEGRRRAGQDRLHLWRVAAGSANEVCAGLQVADAWGYVGGARLAELFALCDRVLAMLWRLTH